MDKPEGITSFIASKRVKKILNADKTGHNGTLDPMATGVLLVLVGGATRFSEFICCNEKSYKANFILGTKTDTLDITGTVLSQRNDFKITEDQVIRLSNDFKGNIKQIPPMYSAISKDGVKLYKLARAGIEVEREPRDVFIKSLEIKQIEEINFEINVTCSSGTYIRSLIADIGEKLGVGACMTSLVRTSSNRIKLEDCVNLDNLDESSVHPLDSVLSDYPKLNITAGQTTRFFNGGELDADRLTGCKDDGLYRVYSDEDVFLGIGEKAPSYNVLKVRKRLSYGE